MYQPCHGAALRVVIEVPEDHENYKTGASPVLPSIHGMGETDQRAIKALLKGAAGGMVQLVQKSGRFVKLLLNTVLASMKIYEQYLYMHPTSSRSWRCPDLPNHLASAII